MRSLLTKLATGRMITRPVGTPGFIVIVHAGDR